MIYLYSGGGDLIKQVRVNKAAADKVLEIAQNNPIFTIDSEYYDIPELDRISTILLIEPSIELALDICRNYSHHMDIVIAESALVGMKLTVCQVEFEVIKICVL
ncbi:hypothetical protein M997_2467 [Proteus hauseri ATCC 700826]|uniref:Uncharacterized protein n=1 Tax=Proteus hauseri ATCC 700826 TaxID=1354271 RepID=A0AAJ3LT57_PROHU|nr:hypothetical protein [Proteus hauseri]OAT46016.1 hypothetical protein M997_2467 [Proteus hauseri ATCC 700826]